MHMADALVSPAVGTAFWAASAASIALSSAHLSKGLDERKVPLMGVFAAFVFTAQMINFTIPATGSSGHLSGGLLLAILLGPAAAFLAIASILTIQALFFADGGLLALGCNIFNLGVFPAFIAYPFIYRKLVGQQPRPSRMFLAAIIAAVIALQCGAFGVVLQTVMSGVSALPFATFALLMQPIHLAIGVVEGIATALVVSFVYRARPDILQTGMAKMSFGELQLRSLCAAFILASVLLAGGLSWFASEHPDGLEWSIARITGSGELSNADLTGHISLDAVQEKTAIMADYALPGSAGLGNREQIGTSLAGIVGGGMSLVICTLVGCVLRGRGKG